MFSRMYEGYDERENVLREEMPSIDEMKSDDIYLYTSDDFMQNLNTHHYDRALVIDGKHSEEDSATNITHAKNSRKIALIDRIYDTVKIQGDDYLAKYCQLVQQIKSLIIKPRYLRLINNIFDWFPISYNTVYDNIYSLDKMGVRFSSSYDSLNKILSKISDHHFYSIDEIISHLNGIIASIKEIEENGISDKAMKIIDSYINDPNFADHDTFNCAIVEAIDPDKSRLKYFYTYMNDISKYIDTIYHNNRDAMRDIGIINLDIYGFSNYKGEKICILMTIIMTWYDHVIDNILYFKINESIVIYPKCVNRYFIPVMMMCNSIFRSSITYEKALIDIYWK